jgi:hypothetical protein
MVGYMPFQRMASGSSQSVNGIDNSLLDFAPMTPMILAPMGSMGMPMPMTPMTLMPVALNGMNLNNTNNNGVNNNNNNINPNNNLPPSPSRASGTPERTKRERDIDQVVKIEDASIATPSSSSTGHKRQRRDDHLPLSLPGTPVDNEQQLLGSSLGAWSQPPIAAHVVRMASGTSVGSNGSNNSNNSNNSHNSNSSNPFTAFLREAATPTPSTTIGSDGIGGTSSTSPPPSLSSGTPAASSPLLQPVNVSLTASLVEDSSNATVTTPNGSSMPPTMSRPTSNSSLPSHLAHLAPLQLPPRTPPSVHGSSAVSAFTSPSTNAAVTSNTAATNGSSSSSMNGNNNNNSTTTVSGLPPASPFDLPPMSPFTSSMTTPNGFMLSANASPFPSSMTAYSPFPSSPFPSSMSVGGMGHVGNVPPSSPFPSSPFPGSNSSYHLHGASPAQLLPSRSGRSVTSIVPFSPVPLTMNGSIGSITSIDQLASAVLQPTISSSSAIASLGTPVSLVSSSSLSTTSSPPQVQPPLHAPSPSPPPPNSSSSNVQSSSSLPSLSLASSSMGPPVAYKRQTSHATGSTGTTGVHSNTNTNITSSTSSGAS